MYYPAAVTDPDHFRDVGSINRIKDGLFGTQMKQTQTVEIDLNHRNLAAE